MSYFHLVRDIRLFLDVEPHFIFLPVHWESFGVLLSDRGVLTDKIFTEEYDFFMRSLFPSFIYLLLLASDPISQPLLLRVS